MGHVTRPHPFWGQFFIHRLGLATFNLYTKFEVSMFTDYEDMKDNAKCRNWGDWELQITKVTGNVTNQHSTYDLLFDFNRNYL